MPIRFLIFALVCVLGIGGFAVQTIPKSSAQNVSECSLGHFEGVTIEHVGLDPASIRRAPKAEIRQVASEGGARQLPGYNVSGVTAARAMANVRVRAAAIELESGEFCIQPVKMDARFGYADHEVLIWDRYNPDGCAYNATVDHEMRHVSVNRSVIEGYSSYLRDRITKVARETLSYRASSPERVYSMLVSAVKSATRQVQEEAERRRDRENGKLDTTEAYHSDFARCDDWSS